MGRLIKLLQSSLSLLLALVSDGLLSFFELLLIDEVVVLERLKFFIKLKDERTSSWDVVL